MRHLVGVDVGGIFTDVLLMPLDGSRFVIAKVPTTADPAEGVVQGVLEAARRARLDPDNVDLILNGTTIVTNTVVERRGARVGVLVTRGFRYVLEIARSWTPGPVSGWMVWEKPAPLADVRDIREVGGRIDAGGRLLEQFDEAEIRVAVRELVERRIEALTVSLFNGYLRPDLEGWVGEIAQDEAPELAITLGSAVLPEFREYERTLVAVANAYVQPARRSTSTSAERAHPRRLLPGAGLSNSPRSSGWLSRALVVGSDTSSPGLTTGALVPNELVGQAA